ncbi:P2Y purinoceptor 8-like [Hoplias malabaricus]|uniref:P2Y purinoceptor 8-like n=1 Tax=Hoplias malabaricus TaxID=27720 RepID=UPI003461EF36
MSIKPVFTPHLESGIPSLKGKASHVPALLFPVSTVPQGQGNLKMNMNSTLNSTNVPNANGGFDLSETVLILSTHAINLLVSLPLNSYVIILLFPGHGAMDASEVLNLNQAFAELVLVILGPFHSMCIVDLNLCLSKPLGFLLGLSVMSRCVFQCCVCVERYVAVVHPVAFLKYKPLRYRLACCVLTWLGMFAVGVWCSVTYPSVPYTVFAAIYLLILAVDVFCGLSILRKLVCPGPRGVESNVSEMNLAKKKAFVIVSVNLLLFLIQNVPISVAFGMEQSVSSYEFGLTLIISLAINTVTGFLQPLSVLRRHGKLSRSVESQRPHTSSKSVDDIRVMSDAVSKRASDMQV